MQPNAPERQPEVQTKHRAGAKVLVVDDNELALLMLEKQLGDLGYDVVTVDNGRDGLDLLRTGQFSVVLLDRLMPGMDGMQVVHAMSADQALRRIPIIMVTAADHQDDVREGIEAGVFYYLAKPAEPALLASVISAAQRQARESERLRSAASDTTGFALAQAAKFDFRTLAEAEALAGFIANIFDDPERTLPGIGALLINAVEHGLCGIGYEQKGRLLIDGRRRAEVDRLCAARAGAAPATASVVRRDGGVALAVADPGPGFDWRERLRMETSASSGSHGRGLIIARTISFDKLAFNEAGNQAVAFAAPRRDIDW